MVCNAELTELDCDTGETMEEILPFINENFALLLECLNVSGVSSIDLIPDIKMNVADPVNVTDFVSSGRIVNSELSGVGLPLAMSKNLNLPWVEGAGLGGMIDGVKTINTVYIVYALFTSDFSKTDYGFLDADTDITGLLPLTGDFTTYRKIKVIQTNGLGEIISYVNAGEYFSYSIRSENHFTPDLSAVYSVMDHSTFAPIDMIEKMEYGVNKTAAEINALASDDGINFAFAVGTSAGADTGDTGVNTWGQAGKNSSPQPFNVNRLFKMESGTGTLLCHQLKINIEV